MPWSRPLSEPIVLKDGREIVTLNDARAIMRSLPAQTQNNDVWLYTGDLFGSCDVRWSHGYNHCKFAARPQG
jgi:hypothetical protein